MHRLGKNRFNGLYIYSYHLGKGLYKYVPGHIELHYYLPRNLLGIFGEKIKYITQLSLDKFFHRKAVGFDIWHSTTTISWYMPADKKTKFIFTLHDINFIIENPESEKSNQRTLSRIQKRIDRADHIIVISEFSLSQAKKYLNLSNKPISVIYPGCSFNTEAPGTETPAYLPGKNFLFSIGLIEKRKNFHVVIPLLKNNDYEYVIAGIKTYDYKETILQEAKKYGVEDRVIFAGGISEEEKAWYYQHCTAFMFPSFAEGFGSPVVEAMYYGKPVFLSRETSLPEIGGEHAYYFSSFDEEQMQKEFTAGMKHYELHQPQEKIKQHARKFSYDTMSQKILALYESLLQ